MPRPEDDEEEGDEQDRFNSESTLKLTKTLPHSLDNSDDEVVTAGRVIGAPIANADPFFTLGKNDYFVDQWLDFIEGATNINEHYGKIHRAYLKLKEITGESYTVKFHQTNSIGMAFGNGIILLDYSTISKPEDIAAYWLAHEWAHHLLGHGSNIESFEEKYFKFLAFPTANEDAADRFAGQFLKKADYDIGPVYKHLKSLPDSPYDLTHSPGVVRAEIALEGFESIGVPAVIPSTASPNIVPSPEVRKAITYTMNIGRWYNGQTAFNLRSGDQLTWNFDLSQLQFLEQFYLRIVSAAGDVVTIDPAQVGGTYTGTFNTVGTHKFEINILNHQYGIAGKPIQGTVNVTK